LTPVFSRIAQKFDIVDIPDSRKIHMEVTPLLGGAAVFIAFLVSVLVNGIFSLGLGAILIASTAIFLIGVLDDVKDISAVIKLIVQVLSTVLVMSCGIVLRVIPENLGIFSLAGNVFLTIIWIIGITNAMNFFMV
jgi:UDP-GlcNAc:undecaprenyl-phosphate GlcNAc-1-phosphate transferase